MKIGKLRHLVTFIGYETFTNDFGEEEKTEVEVLKTWAEIKPVTSKEYFNQGDFLKTTHRVIVRYSPIIKPTQKIKFEDREFEITGIRDFFEKHKFFEIMAKEIT